MNNIYMNALFTLFFVLFKLQIVDSHWNWHDDSSSSLSSNEEQQYKPKRAHSKPKIQEERRTLDQLYAAALKEGGRLILYAGGDTAGQQDWTKMAFERRFPNITLDVVVDYSKFHAPRIDYQLANRSLVPDVVQLQTVQDFPRWKEMGVLKPYKPAGWNAIYKDYRDPDSYFTGIVVYSFSNVVNSRLVPNQSEWPREAADYLKPKFAGKKLVITYPTDEARSSKTDVPAPAGFRRSWEYPHLTSHKAFAAFMEDREAAERFRHQLVLFLGEAQGPPSPGYPGIHPDKALPH
uniref:DUF1574 domain-containing protein n=1 Tax=Globodera pallida TaxID=36090 RepID=A0A183BT18_GLOPA